MIAATRPLDLVLDRLPGAQENGAGWKSRCPAHEDHTPSLSVRLGEDDRVLLHCFAGCTPEDIVSAIGLTMTDLFPPKERQQRRVIAETNYRALDIDGTLHGTHRRLDYSDGSKDVFWFRPDGTKGLGGRKLEMMPLYGSEQLPGRPGEVPIMCEGEKAAQALIDAGYLALGTVTGANVAPNAEVLAVLTGRPEVILWPDHDVPGVTHMMRIAHTLEELGVHFRIVTWPGAPEKGDAYDCIAQRGNVDVLLAAAVAPAWNRDTAPPTPKPSRIVRASDCTLAPPDYLIDGILPRNSLASIVGAPATMKTFIAIGMAAAIHTGRDWCGRPVERGTVLYLAAEGAGGMRRRLRAWELAHEAGLGDLWILPTSVNFLSDGDLGDLEAEVAALPEPPALIVVDTLARNFGGGNENAADDMGRFIASCDRLRTLTGACVLIIHHENKLGGYRGSTAFLGALDTMIEAKREGLAVTLTNRKMKDDGEFAPIHLAVRVMDLGFLDRHERPVTSVVLQPTDSAFVEQQRQASSGDRALTEKERNLLAIIAGMPGRQITYSEWHSESGLPQSTFDRVRSKLIERGLVRPLGHRGYEATPALNQPPNDPRGGITPTPIPLSGVGVGVNLGVDEEGDEEDDEDGNDLPF